MVAVSVAAGVTSGASGASGASTSVTWMVSPMVAAWPWTVYSTWPV